MSAPAHSLAATFSAALGAIAHGNRLAGVEANANGQREVWLGHGLVGEGVLKLDGRP